MVYQLTGEDVAELDAAFQQIKSKRLIVPNFGKDEFPMPKLAARLDGHIKELEFGVGILNIVGFPVEKYSKDESQCHFLGESAVILAHRLGTKSRRSLTRGCSGYKVASMEDTSSTRGYQTTVQSGPAHRWCRYCGPGVPEKGKGGRRESACQRGCRTQQADRDQPGGGTAPAGIPLSTSTGAVRKARVKNLTTS